MIRIDPEWAFGLTLAVALLHLACALAVGIGVLQAGPGPGWSRVRDGLRFHSLAGLGIGAVSAVVAWRVSPGRVSAPESWVMGLGLAAAAVGQIRMIGAMRAGGALSAPAAGESRLPRLYIVMTPLVVFVLLAVLFVLRGVH